MAAPAQAAKHLPDNAAKPRVIILTGPTAVGKTAASLELARAINGEIISADSVQVYRGLDIGSAKIPEHERQSIPHHLLDVADATDDFSAGVFFHEARRVTAEVLQRGKTPILVGGTGFYLRWFIYGKPDTPVSNEALAAAAKEKLDQAWEEAAANADGAELTPQQKWQAGVSLVAALGDPESAAELTTVPNNYYRMLRVLQIMMATGRPRSKLNLDTKAPLDYDIRCFYLDRPRISLYRRIDLRCEQMLQGGMLQECASLLRRGLKPDDNSATRAIGYRQGMEYMTKWQADPASLAPKSMMALLEEVQAGSRRYAHTQIKWARGVELFRWLDATRSPAEIVAEIQQHLQDEPYTGGSGENGLLTKEQAREMKCYQTKQQVLCDSHAVQELCAQTRMLLQ